MANIDENFVVKTGLTVGPTIITAATGNLNTTGNVKVGNTVIEGSSGNVYVGSTTINGVTGAITTTANVTTVGGNFIVNGSILSPTGGSFANSTISNSTINSTVIGGTTPAAGNFTTLDATGTITTNDILPHVTNVSNIGSATQRFSSIYVNEAHLSVNTLYLGNTPILGTSDNVVNIHADAGQAISMQTSGAAGNMTFVSNAQMTHQTTGNNADILIQSNGTGSKTRILSGTSLEMTAPTIAAAGNVTVTGSTTTGDLIVNGNVTVTGSQASVNAVELTVKDNIIIVNAGETGTGVTAGLAGIQFARGQVSSYQLAFKESDQSLQFGPVGSTAPVATQAWVTSQGYAGANATLTQAAQPNITSLGTLTSLSTSGAVTVGTNLTVTGNLTVSGSTTTINATTLDVADLNITVAKNAVSAAAANGAGLTIGGAGATMTYANTGDKFVFNKPVEASSFIGSGANLTSIPNSALYHDSFGIMVGPGLFCPQTYVALGEGISIDNTGVLELSPVLGSGITVSGPTGSVQIGSTATALNTASTIVARDASGGFSAGFISAELAGNATTASNIKGGAVWQIPYQSAAATTAFIGAGTTGQILTATTGAAPSWKTLTKVDSITVSGTGISVNQASGAVTLSSTATALNTASAIVQRDASGNFSAGVITATSTNARYADLAEKYLSDAEYEPGTVVSFGGEFEVTLATRDGDRRVAGVVTTAPAYLMNSELQGTSVAIALQGRVPCKVTGKVKKGDMLIAGGQGYARVDPNPISGQMIGKALQDFDGVNGVIEVAVGRM